MRVYLAAVLVCFATISKADEIDDYIKSVLEQRDVPGLALAVVNAGEVIKAEGYGFANLEHEVTVEPDTVFQIQSITKQFTATAIMMLAEEGKLSVEDPVSEHLEESPELWAEITIRHLLTHTSGIKDFINERVASLRIDISEKGVFDQTAQRPLNFEPGERYQYSNTNYHLLAMIIREITGQYYGDFLKERIFEPLGMIDTRVNNIYSVQPRRASGYRLIDGEIRHGDFVAQSILSYAGGGILSTVEDMAKWDAALYGEKLIKQASIERMFSRTPLNDGSESTYGFGWASGARNGHTFVSHTGGHVTGFSTCILRFYEAELTVIVFTNVRGAANPSEIANRVAEFYVEGLKPDAIEDADPEVTALVRKILQQTIDGKLEEELFTEEFWAFVQTQDLEQMQANLKALGPMKNLSLLDKAEADEIRSFTYRAEFGLTNLKLVIELNEDGRISGMTVEPGTVVGLTLTQSDRV